MGCPWPVLGRKGDRSCCKACSALLLTVLKPISLLSGEGSSFKAAAEAHPAFLDPKDAESVTIPMCILASKDENAEAVKSFSETLKVEKYVETFADQIHGWMGAR